MCHARKQSNQPTRLYGPCVLGQHGLDWAVPPGGAVRLSSQTVRKSSGITSEMPERICVTIISNDAEPRGMQYFLIV